MSNRVDRPAVEFSVVLASVVIHVLGAGMPLVLGQVYDRIIPRQAVDTLVLLGGALLVTATLEFATQLSRSVLLSWSGLRFETTLRRRLIGVALASDLRAFETQTPGGQLDRIAGVDRLRDHYAGENAIALTEAPALIVYALALMLLSPYLLLWPLAVLLLGAAATLAMRRAVEESGKRRIAIDSQRYSFLLETLRGLETIKMLGVGQMMRRRYDRLLDAGARCGGDVIAAANLSTGAQAMLVQLTTIGVACLGAALVVADEITVGALAAALMLAPRAVQPGLRVLTLTGRADDIAMRRRQIAEMLRTPQRAPGDRPAPALRRLGLSNAAYRAPGGRLLLGDVDLHVSVGEAVGVVGPSGSGKSTLMWLLSGEIAPDAGSWRVNGEDGRAFDPDAMRRRIAFLSQRHSLLGGSILDNLSGFDVPRNGERAIALARKLGIEGVLRDNGEALSERTAEAAEAKLSASLVNAICIVRALAADPTAILFDEANLSLDRELDQKLLSYLAEIKPAKAMVIVSHRPSYLALADRVYELRSGRLLQVYEADRAGHRGWWRPGAEGETPRLANAS